MLDRWRRKKDKKKMFRLKKNIFLEKEKIRKKKIMFLYKEKYITIESEHKMIL